MLADKKQSVKGDLMRCLLLAVLATLFVSSTVWADTPVDTPVPAAHHSFFNVLTDGRVVVKNHKTDWSTYLFKEVAYTGVQEITTYGGREIVTFTHFSHLDWFGFTPDSTVPRDRNTVVALRVGGLDSIVPYQTGYMRTIDLSGFTVFEPRVADLVLTDVDPSSGPITLFIFTVNGGQFESLAPLGMTRCLGELTTKDATVRCGSTDLVLQLQEVREFMFPTASTTPSSP